MQALHLLDHSRFETPFQSKRNLFAQQGPFDADADREGIDHGRFILNARRFSPSRMLGNFDRPDQALTVTEIRDVVNGRLRPPQALGQLYRIQSGESPGELGVRRDTGHAVAQENRLEVEAGPSHQKGKTPSGRRDLRK